MTDAVDRVRDAVRAGRLLQPDRPVVVLLSGGRDSVCLLDVAIAVAGAGAVTALHVNHGLRGADADADESHCLHLCETLDVNLTVSRAAERPAGNVQAWARELRYAAGRELAAARDADLAAGHTASDQVETILYRVAASPGRRALLGMEARAGRLVRPLLELTRAETRAYCTARGLPWREDASNADPAHARARVRHALLPALRSLHPAAERNVLRTAELLRDEAEVLDELVAAVLGDEASIELTRLRQLPPALRRLVVRRLAEAACERPVPAAAARTDELLALGGAGRRRSMLDLEGGVRAVVERDSLHFETTPPI